VRPGASAIFGRRGARRSLRKPLGSKDGVCRAKQVLLLGVDDFLILLIAAVIAKFGTAPAQGGTTTQG